jgi:hypothetical protein
MPVGTWPVPLPNADHAVVDTWKIVGYLLNPAHPDNGGKARFFEALGFSLTDPARLAAALRGVAVSGETLLHVESRHGSKYIVDG